MISMQTTTHSRASFRWFNPRSIANMILLTAVLLFVSVSFADEAEPTSNSSSQESSQQTYGPITKQDTMWFIANRIHPDRSVSIYQTMAALVDANPELFPEDNINRLSTGVTLFVPSASDIRAQDAELARTRMIPLLGGEFVAAEMAREARVQGANFQGATAGAEQARIDELQAAHEARLSELQQQLADTERELRTVQRSNRELSEQVSDLEAALSVAESVNVEQAAAPQTLQREVVIEENYEPSLAWFLAWPGVLIPVAFIGLILAFLILVFRKNTSDEKSNSPHKVATAAHLAEASESEAQAPAHEATGNEVPEATQAGVETEAPAQTHEKVENYREISEILDEAEADADDDSDVDAGQTKEEAMQAQREELAAQIDLARAYLEMGELDEGIAALEEVMPIADAELQAEAEQLLAKIKEQK
ncbi:hypothetical protein CWE08_05910 [Aliidiomarina iranensis]|uniref:LysM domain-containing protein n=1 Tax=Aliidiomarina iranensis TaxID=1434071 RepID=A0A432VX37_9GAMM|nr:FimV/HubP family polar landmark protein [Aliidiomarina iranensis]RUO21125.1 hypothetical protein CWE08_05910 [Aliidiomarina iranensis]